MGRIGRVDSGSREMMAVSNSFLCATARGVAVQMATQTAYTAMLLTSYKGRPLSSSWRRTLMAEPECSHGAQQHAEFLPVLPLPELPHTVLWQGLDEDFATQSNAPSKNNSVLQTLTPRVYYSLEVGVL